VLIFVLALNNFAVPTLLQTKVYPAEIWLTFNTRFDYMETLRLSWPLIAGPLLLIYCFRSPGVWFSHRNREFDPGLLRQRLGKVGVLTSGFVLAALLAVSLLLPLGQLLFSARMWAEFVPAIQAAADGLGNSFMFAAGSALAVLAVGIGLRKWKW